MYFTDNPVEFGQFAIDQIGQENYDRLLEHRRSTSKVDWQAEASRLETIAKEKGLI
jgi:hypothetical protein